MLIATLQAENTLSFHNHFNWPHHSIAMDWLEISPAQDEEKQAHVIIPPEFDSDLSPLLGTDSWGHSHADRRSKLNSIQMEW